MEELINRLEQQIKDLVAQHDRLRDFNQQLNHGKSAVIREKELLLAKQKKAILQIQNLVSRLKTIEKTS